MLTSHPPPEVRLCQSRGHVIAIVPPAPSLTPPIDFLWCRPLNLSPCIVLVWFTLLQGSSSHYQSRHTGLYVFMLCMLATQQCLLPKKRDSFWIIFLPDLKSKYVNMWPHITAVLFMSYNHSHSPRMWLAHKHDQNTYLDLFVCNCPIKHILCISISGLWSQWELLAEKCYAFKLQGTAMWAMFRVG